MTSQSLEEHDGSQKERAVLRERHKREQAKSKKTEETLDLVEECIRIAILNYKGGNHKKAGKHLRKAFKLFLRTLKSENFKARKLALFNSISVCHELWCA